MYYTMPVLLPDNERVYNIYAWEPTTHSNQLHVLNINSDGLDLAGKSPNISWAGQFGTNCAVAEVFGRYGAAGPVDQAWARVSN